MVTAPITAPQHSTIPYRTNYLKLTMDINLRFPETVSSAEIEQYFKSIGLEVLIDPSHAPKSLVNEMIQESPYPSELDDLYRLHQFIILNKRTTVLEFGCGWSTLVMAHAIEDNRKKYWEEVKSLRRNNPFEVSVVDNEKRYLQIAKKRVKEAGFENVEFLYSRALMTKFNDRLATNYECLPLINPDFIYLDGPDQFNVEGLINGLSTAHKDFMPMSSDILLFEHFLTPGTIIVVDGRAANSRFLRSNLQRNWTYTYDESGDQHIFQMDEEPLGEYSKKQLEFYSKAPF